jgi:hypothetical protein
MRDSMDSLKGMRGAPGCRMVSGFVDSRVVVIQIGKPSGAETIG